MPEEMIRRRYARSVSNLLRLYTPVVSSWRVYDNTEYTPKLVAEAQRSYPETIHDVESWSKLREVAGHG